MFGQKGYCELQVFNATWIPYFKNQGFFWAWMKYETKQKMTKCKKPKKNLKGFKFLIYTFFRNFWCANNQFREKDEGQKLLLIHNSFLLKIDVVAGNILQ